MGPGEFAEGWLGIFVDADGAVVARDNSSNVLMFDSELIWRRSWRIPIAAVPGFAHLMEGQRILVTYPTASPPTHYFEVVELGDSAASNRRRFGEVRQAEIRARMNVGRASTYVGNGSFWVAPVEGSPVGYRLEKWNIDGRMLRVLERHPPWFPRPRVLRQAARPDGQPPPPHVKLIHAINDGALFIVIRVNDRRWRPLGNRDSIAALEDELYDWRYEVIDAEAGVVLASSIADTLHEVPYMMFPGDLRGYVWDDNDARSPMIRVVRVGLARRGEPPVR